MVLGPRAVFVLGCWVACSQFTDLVEFRPSSVASVNSRMAVPDSAIVQQPKDPAVCPVCLPVCLHHTVLSSTIIIACPPSRAAGLPNAARVYRHNQSSVPSRPSVPLPLTSTAYAHPSAASRPFHVAVHAAIASATALVPLDHGALPPFPRHRSCTFPNLAPCAHRPSHQPGSVLATLVCAAASGTSRLRRVR